MYVLIILSKLMRRLFLDEMLGHMMHGLDLFVVLLQYRDYKLSSALFAYSFGWIFVKPPDRTAVSSDQVEVVCISISLLCRVSLLTLNQDLHTFCPKCICRNSWNQTWKLVQTKIFLRQHWPGIFPLDSVCSNWFAASPLNKLSIECISERQWMLEV